MGQGRWPPRPVVAAAACALLLLLLAPLPRQSEPPTGGASGGAALKYAPWDVGGANSSLETADGRNHRPGVKWTTATEVAGVALLLFGALSCWTCGAIPSPEIPDSRFDFGSIPGGGASEGHRLRFVQSPPNYGTWQPTHIHQHHSSDACHAETGTPGFPSGMWCGYFNHGSPVPNPFAIRLSFRDGRVTDTGHDAVGDFRVTGVYSARTLKVAFGKQYVLGTGDPRRNEGQVLEYRGARAFNLAQGLRGTWHVRSARVRLDGNFHLWPVMPFWNLRPPRPLMSEAAAHGARVVKVRHALGLMGSQHCGLCVRRPIAAVLVPCGHAALCLACARDLCVAGAACCPLCHRAVAQVQVEIASTASPRVAPQRHPAPIPALSLKPTSRRPRG